MDFATKILFYIATLSVLIFTFAIFLRGFNIIEKYENEQRRRHWQEQIGYATGPASQEPRS